MAYEHKTTALSLVSSGTDAFWLNALCESLIELRCRSDGFPLGTVRAAIPVHAFDAELWRIWHIKGKRFSVNDVQRSKRRACHAWSSSQTCACNPQLCTGGCLGLDCLTYAVQSPVEVSLLRLGAFQDCMAYRSQPVAKKWHAAVATGML